MEDKYAKATVGCAECIRGMPACMYLLRFAGRCRDAVSAEDMDWLVVVVVSSVLFCVCFVYVCVCLCTCCVLRCVCCPFYVVSVPEWSKGVDSSSTVFAP